jgi:hypothetical protein
MKNSAVAAFRDALCDDFESARQHLTEMTPEELKRLQRACMGLQNLSGARLYALAQWGDAGGGRAKEEDRLGTEGDGKGDFLEA